MIQIEYLPIVLTGIGIMASILYYASVLRNQNKTRQTQLFMNIHEQHISMPTVTIIFEMMWEWDWRDFDDYAEKYMYPNNKENHVKFGHYFASLERLGVLCKKGLIDPELVYDSQPHSIIYIWEKFLPIIKVRGIHSNSHLLYYW